MVRDMGESSSGSAERALSHYHVRPPFIPHSPDPRMSAVPPFAAPARFAVDYVSGPPQALLADPGVLAVFGFGDAAPERLDDPRYLNVPLQPYPGDAPCEVWRVDGTVRHGREGDIAWAGNGSLAFGVIEVNEGAHVGADDPTGMIGAAAHAYARLAAFIGASRTPHLLKIWNYIDAITLGEGDDERYRQFCVGRVRGLGGVDASRLPAATAIGCHNDARVLQVYWLAAAEPGAPVENPRQVSAWRYPRAYGPQPPSFARAMLPPTGSRMPLLLSGTASVVGHATAHPGAVRARVDETLASVAGLIGAARERQPGLPPRFGGGSRLKVYVRDRTDIDAVAAALDARFSDRVPRVVLHAAICRRDLA